MISREELDYLRREIEDSKNPLFLFDNDPDGFTSVLILLKNFGKGSAFPIKSFPNLDYNIFEKIEKVFPDKIFILDKPLNDEKFIDDMKEKGIEVIVIDHHEIILTEELKKKAKFFTSYPSSEPTSYICQKIVDNKNTRWISLIGSIHDVFLPDFIGQFGEEYPELIDTKLDISRMKYGTEIGKLARILSLGLKSSNQTIENIFNLFLEANGPNDILMENERNNFLHKKFNQMNKIIEKALTKTKFFGETVYLEYAGEYSLSSDIANKLFFLHPDKFIIVVYKKYDSVNISVRGKNAKKFTEEVVKKIPSSSGGGHEVACGLRVLREELGNFKKLAKIS